MNYLLQLIFTFFLLYLNKNFYNCISYFSHKYNKNEKFKRNRKEERGYVITILRNLLTIQYILLDLTEKLFAIAHVILYYYYIRNLFQKLFLISKN
jgi:hypothetical protein